MNVNRADTQPVPVDPAVDETARALDALGAQLAAPTMPVILQQQAFAAFFHS